MSAVEAVSGIFLAVDGAPVAIEQCDWIAVAPCGCVSGVTVAGMHGNLITTAEQARAQFNDNVAALVKRDRENGWTYRAIRHADFRKEVGAMSCEHEPKWGVQRANLPEGSAWATTDSTYGRKTHVKHIVTEADIATREQWRYHEEPAKALCGMEARVWHKDEWHECVTCRKCEKAATS